MTHIGIVLKHCHGGNPKQQHFFGYLGSLKLFTIEKKKPIGRCNALSAILGLFDDKNPAKYAMVYAA
jgi:hypothetical protein